MPRNPGPSDGRLTLINPGNASSLGVSCWLAIDPKGLIGERVFARAEFFGQQFHQSATGGCHH